MPFPAIDNKKAVRFIFATARNQNTIIPRIMSDIIHNGDILSVDLLSTYFIIYHEVNYMSLIHIFATNVRKYRTEKGLSQEALADLAGLHRTYISAVERERRNISIDNIENIAAALDIEPFVLLQNNK